MGDEAEVQVGRTGERHEQAGAMLERTHDPSRVLALSDGVFAIVITLLVLEVHVPELSQGQSLSGALAEVRPSFNAFVLTFILTGMYWVAHRLWQRLDDRQRRAGLALAACSVLVYLVAILVAEVAPGVSLVIYAAMPVLYFVSITVLRSGRKRDQEYADFT
jgi:amino acid transporter